MNDVVKYLQECGTFYLATVEGDQPHVRPFGAVCEFEGKLYIVTNNKKDVYNQMKVNGKVEMCGMNKGTWIRVKGAVKEDTRREARVAMMEANKNALQSMYIMYLLTDGPIRFNELQRKMPEEMTHTTLSRQLKKLEEEGLIERIEYQQIPPKVEYKLSDIGEKFRKVLKELEIWGNEYIQYLNDKE